MGAIIGRKENDRADRNQALGIAARIARPDVLDPTGFRRSTVRFPELIPLLEIVPIDQLREFLEPTSMFDQRSLTASQIPKRVQIHQ